MKWELNYLSTADETEAASEVVLDAFTHSLMKLRCHKCIYTATFQIYNNPLHELNSESSNNTRPTNLYSK